MFGKSQFFKFFKNFHYYCLISIIELVFLRKTSIFFDQTRNRKHTFLIEHFVSKQLILRFKLETKQLRSSKNWNLYRLISIFENMFLLISIFAGLISSKNVSFGNPTFSEEVSIAKTIILILASASWWFWLISVFSTIFSLSYRSDLYHWDSKQKIYFRRILFEEKVKTFVPVIKIHTFSKSKLQSLSMSLDIQTLFSPWLPAWFLPSRSHPTTLYF